MEKLTIESCKKIQTYKDVRELLEGWKKNKVASHETYREFTLTQRLMTISTITLDWSSQDGDSACFKRFVEFANAKSTRYTWNIISNEKEIKS